MNAIFFYDLSIFTEKVAQFFILKNQKFIDKFINIFPVLLQVAVSVGVNPIQFGVIMVLNLVIGLCTPPVGVCLFVTSSIGKISLAKGTKGVLPFVAVCLVVLLLVTYVPPVTLGLVKLVFGSV